jgi:flagellar hook-associated protein 3 FlgL
MRISTSQTWNSALLNLTLAQQTQFDANEQYTTQKVSTDLKGYGRTAEILASHQFSQGQLKSYLEVNQAVSDRLASQDTALVQVADAAGNAKQHILEAIASGKSDGLSEALSGDLAQALSGLNFKFQGAYLFGGGNEDTQPLAISTLSDLDAYADPSLAFANGTIKKVSKIDAHTNLQTGMLASDIGDSLIQAFKDLRDFLSANPVGSLDETQKTTLGTIANAFTAANSELNNKTALNGTLQNQVENTMNSLTTQSEALQKMIADKTDVDMAEAYTKVQQAQQAVQASAQILSNLNSISLLNYLK